MGKTRKKKATIDYDELFRSEPKKSEDDWFRGLSSLMLDEDPSAPAKTWQVTAAAAAADGMDTADVAATKQPKKKTKTRQGLQLQGTAMKTGRGKRTAVQKKRQADKQEKALARADKAAVKVSRRACRRQQVAAFKALY